MRSVPDSARARAPGKSDNVETKTAISKIKRGKNLARLSQNTALVYHTHTHTLVHINSLKLYTHTYTQNPLPDRTSIIRRACTYMHIIHVCAPSWNYTHMYLHPKFQNAQPHCVAQRRRARVYISALSSASKGGGKRDSIMIFAKAARVFSSAKRVSSVRVFLACCLPHAGVIRAQLRGWCICTHTSGV